MSRSSFVGCLGGQIISMPIKTHDSYIQAMDAENYPSRTAMNAAHRVDCPAGHPYKCLNCPYSCCVAHEVAVGRAKR